MRSVDQFGCNIGCATKAGKMALAEIGLFGTTGLGKTYSLLGGDSFFHACRTSQAYCERGIGSAEPGVFTLLSRRITFCSKSTCDQRREKPSLYVLPPVWERRMIATRRWTGAASKMRFSSSSVSILRVGLSRSSLKCLTSAAGFEPLWERRVDRKREDQVQWPCTCEAAFIEHVGHSLLRIFFWGCSRMTGTRKLAQQES
jgi:hypothetical protein